MRRIAVAILLALSAAGCGSSGGDSARAADSGGGQRGGGSAPPASAAVAAGARASGDVPAAAASSSAAADTSGVPPIEFEPAELDFGMVEPGSTRTGTVTIRNLGAAPLRIGASRTSCGCTATDDLAGRTIPAGGSTTFQASMAMKSGLGQKMEKVRMLFEGYTDHLVDYVLRAEVTLPVRAVPPHLTATETLTGTVVVESLDGLPFRVLAAGGAPPDFTDFDPASETPRSRYTLRWDLRDLDRRGQVPWFWVIETDRADCPVVDLRIRHRTTAADRPMGRPWVPKDQRVLVGVVRNGEAVEIAPSIEYAPNQTPDLAGARASSDSSFLRAALLDVQRDGQILHYRVRVTPVGVPPGLLYGRIRLAASGFDTTVRVVGRVEE